MYWTEAAGDGHWLYVLNTQLELNCSTMQTGGTFGYDGGLNFNWALMSTTKQLFLGTSGFIHGINSLLPPISVLNFILPQKKRSSNFMALDVRL